MEKACQASSGRIAQICMEDCLRLLKNLTVFKMPLGTPERRTNLHSVLVFKAKAADLRT